jgi:hypothetical protein
MMQHLEHEFYLKLEEYVVKTHQVARNVVHIQHVYKLDLS